MRIKIKTNTRFNWIKCYEEILQLEAGQKSRGKRKDIDHTFKSIKTQVKDAIKEKKGF
jgi:hypothetical protein